MKVSIKKMDRILFDKMIFFFLLLGCLFGFGQDRKTKERIDSLNNVSYEDRIETSHTNTQKYIDNLETATAIDYKLGIADSYANLSLIYFYKGEYDISTGYLFKAIDLYKAIGELGKAGYLYGLFGYNLRSKDIRKAIQYMQTGIKLAEKANANFELLSLYDNYGVVKETNQEYDSAFYYYNKSLDLKRKANNQVGIPYSLNKIAYLNALLGNYSLAKKDFDEAYNMRLKLNDKVGIAENLSFYGEFYEMQNDHDRALNYYKQALVASREAGYRWLTYQIYEKLSKNYEAKHDFKNAYTNLKSHMNYKDSIYALETTTHVNQLEAEFDTKEKEKKILEQKVILAEQKLDIQQKNHFMLFLGTLILLIGISGFLILRFYRLKNQQLKRENQLKDSLHKVEAENRVQQERLRISRDLHDNIGSQLTFIISSIENINFKLKNENPEVYERLKKINIFTKGTINELRDTIWAMNKNEISFSDLESRINNFVGNAAMASPQINFKVQMPFELKKKRSFTTFEGINLFRIVQEAINNSIKHSGATEIQVIFENDNYHSSIIVKDDGKGFDTNTSVGGYGLNNMKSRISELGGTVSIESNEDKGTELKFSF